MSVYPPREDSYFLKQYLENLELEDKEVLDMGTGSGILALEMAEKAAEVTAVDINQEAVEEVSRKSERRGLGIDVFKSDLFEHVDAEFDLIVFNPPYLPGEVSMEGGEMWRGGETGVELAESFLEEVDSYLKDGGKAMILVSSRSDTAQLKQKFELDVVERVELWFETLYLAEYK
ncbi:MAG: HemK2/MTQ2 family protein methyltransferase [Candidatus Nanohaloarchaea archaeon]